MHQWTSHYYKTGTKRCTLMSSKRSTIEISTIRCKYMSRKSTATLTLIFWTTWPMAKKVMHKEMRMNSLKCTKWSDTRFWKQSSKEMKQKWPNWKGWKRSKALIKTFNRNWRKASHADLIMKIWTSQSMTMRCWDVQIIVLTQSKRHRVWLMVLERLIRQIF